MVLNKGASLALVPTSAWSSRWLDCLDSLECLSICCKVVLKQIFSREMAIYNKELVKQKSLRWGGHADGKKMESVMYILSLHKEKKCFVLYPMK